MLDWGCLFSTQISAVRNNKFAGEQLVVQIMAHDVSKSKELAMIYFLSRKVMKLFLRYMKYSPDNTCFI